MFKYLRTEQNTVLFFFFNARNSLEKIIKYFFHPGSSNTDSLGAIKDVFYTFSIFNKHFT